MADSAPTHSSLLQRVTWLPHKTLQTHPVSSFCHFYFLDFITEGHSTTQEVEEAASTAWGQHLNKHCSWIPRDKAVPGSCQLLPGHADQHQGKVQTSSNPAQPYTSAWHFIVSVSKNRRDKQLMPLSFHWMHLSVTAATLQRMPGQRALALLALLKILARSCGHRSFWFTRFLRKCTGSEELPLCLQFAGTLPNLFCFQKELKQVLCLCKAA